MIKSRGVYTKSYFYFEINLDVHLTDNYKEFPGLYLLLVP